jgi:Uma2 family endonuclease
MVEVKLGLRTIDLPYTVRFPHITEDQFDELVDEDTKAELFDGVMIVHSPASFLHNQIGRFIRELMNLYAEEKDLGVVFGPDDLIRPKRGRRFAPDAFFLAQNRVPDPLPVMQYAGSPDLVLEVLSPSNREYDLEEKRPAYREADIKEIWFVDPDEQEVIVDRRRPKGYSTLTVTTGRVTSRVLPGFWLEAAWLWSQPMPKVGRCLRRILDT